MIVVAVAVLALTHWYLWRRLVRDVSVPGGWYRRTGTALVLLLPVLTALASFGREVGVPFGVQRVIAWPGHYWIAALLYLTLSLVVGELLRPLLLLRRAPATAAPEPEAGVEPEAARVPAPGPAPETRAAPANAAAAGDRPAEGALLTGERERTGGPEEPGEPAGALPDGSGPSRRLVVSRGIAVGAAVVTAGTVGYGSWAARQLRTKRVTVTLARLPRAAQGYRIAVVSDIHLGPLLGRAHCQRVVDAVNRTQPDLITVVGDLVDAEVDDLRSAAAPLAGLRAREGAYFVTGNHEYYVDTAAWVEHVAELGLTPLPNDRRELAHFDLAGVNDVAGAGSGFGGPDFRAALGDRDPARVSVLMAHQPVQIHDAVDHGVDLQLSGHTHGGQMWPVTYLAGLANPTLAGLERYGDTQLYVSRGAGSWGPPVRVGADPDITVIELATA